MKKNFKNNTNIVCQSCKAALYLAPMLFYSIDAMAVLDLKVGIKAGIDPILVAIDTYYMHGIFVSGVAGMLMQKGDLVERSWGFGKGSVAGGVFMSAVKALLPVV
jgi:hypothetical protein